jgi:nucleoside-diphosphate-sugar epimerase
MSIQENYMSILVIGGNGYIGSRLVPHLRNNNHDVEVYGNRSNDYNKLTKEFLEPFKTIILLAGHSSVQMCVGDIRSPWHNNVRNFINLVEKTSKDTKIIYASSASVYGNSVDVSTENKMSLDILNNYDLTKITLDIVAQKYQAQGRQILGLRFGTVNGGSPVIRRDLMINMMVYAANNEGKITVANKHINRSILSIDDLVRAVERIVYQGRYSFIPGMYNLASFTATVDEISSYVSKKLGIEIIDKGNTAGAYNFDINTDKLCKYYDFKFTETIESTVDSVVSCYKDPTTNVVIRKDYIEYND